MAQSISHVGKWINKVVETVTLSVCALSRVGRDRVVYISVTL